MITDIYLLADTAVRISTLYRQVHTMCADYLTDREPEVFVETSIEEIDEERQKDKTGLAHRQAQEKLNSRKVTFSNSYIESLLVYRKLALQLLDRSILLMHGSCIAVDGEGVLFTAISGTGKSTHTRLWREMLGSKAVMINDDKPLIHVKKGQRPVIYGTPWNGKHNLSTNTCVPLKAVVYLERGEGNEIHEITAKDMFPILIQQTFRTDDPHVTIKVLNLLSELSRNVKFYDLHCNMNPEAAKVSYDAIFG